MRVFTSLRRTLPATLLVAGTVVPTGPLPSLDPPAAEAPTRPTQLEELWGRTARLDVGLGGLERTLIPDLTAVMEILPAWSDDSSLRSTVALRVVAEARQAGLAPALVAAVIFVENPWLLPDTVSSAGAVGLMQVMPLHIGTRDCPDGPLTDIAVNVCYGVSVLATSMRRSQGDVERALLLYNGCVGSRSGCRGYPQRVLARLGRLYAQ